MSTNTEQREQRQRVAKAGAANTVYLIIVLAVVVFLNLIFGLTTVRFDLTHDQRFTLSDASKTLVAELEGEMEIYAFISGDLPTPYSTLERQVNDLLSDYQTHSNGNFSFRIIDPDEGASDEEAEGSGEEAEAEPEEATGRQLADNFGIQPITIVDESQNQISFREVYLGVAVVYYVDGEERTDVVEQLFPGMNLEYEVTRRMRTLVYGEDVPVLGFVVGDGSFLDQIIDQATAQQNPMAPGPDPETVRSELEGQLEQQLFDELFDITFVDLEEDIGDEVQGLIVLGPTEEYSETAQQNLDAFIMSGRGVAIFVSPYRMSALDMQGMQMPQMPQVMVPEPNDHGLDELLAHYGIRVRDDYVIDREAAQISVVMRTIAYMGDQPLQQPVPIEDPRLPLLTEINPESIVAANVPLMAFMPSDRSRPLPTSTLSLTPEAIEANDLGELVVTEVAATNPTSVRLESTMEVELEDAVDGELDGEEGSFPVIVTIEGALDSHFDNGSTDDARVLVASNGEFVANVFNQNDPLRDPRMRRALPPAVSQSVESYSMSTVLFLKNTADWIVQDADLIAIRSRGMPTFIEPENLQPGRRLFYQAMNIAGVPTLFVLIGIAIAFRRRSRRLHYHEMFNRS